MPRGQSGGKGRLAGRDLNDVILRGMNEGVCLTRVSDLTIVYANPKFERMFGYGEGELTGKPVSILNHDDGVTSPAQVAASIDAMLHREGDSSFEVENVRKDGARMWCRMRIAGIEHSEHGKVWVAVQEDITALKAAEQERDRFFELSPDLLCVVGFDRGLLRVNPAWTTVLGWSTAELIGMRPIDLVHPDDRAAADAEGQKIRAGNSTMSFENRYRCKNGGYKWLQWRVVPFPAQSVAYGVARDVTDQKMMLSKLMFADRLASLGTLAAGTAHEINNPLAFVALNLDLILEKVRGLDGRLAAAEMGELEDIVNDARHGAERIRKIVRGLRTFSRADEGENAPIAIRPIVELAVSMVGPEARRRARLITEFGATPLVRADETRLGQVVLNLLVNATQAIPEGHADRNEIRILTATDAQGRAVVAVRDTGSGIAPSDLPRIFDPFFTTKPTGVGTGLGLSICHGIVTELGGEISVDTEAGKGTIFRVVLPPCDATMTRPRSSAPPQSVPARPVRLLVVDDEEMIGATLRRALAGHQVASVRSAAQALEQLRSGQRFDLILCDLAMVPAGGVELYAELARAWPEFLPRLVFMTGGTLTPQASRFLDETGSDYLEKPFDVRRVRTLVRKFAKQSAS